MSYKQINQLLDGNLTSLPVLKAKRKLLKGETACDTCLAGKIKESFNKKTNKREGKKVHCLHANLSGIHSKLVRGYRYYLVVTCNASRLVWLKLLKSKATKEVYLALAKIQANAKQSTSKKCHYFRANNSTREFRYTF